MSLSTARFWSTLVSQQTMSFVLFAVFLIQLCSVALIIIYPEYVGPSYIFEVVGRCVVLFLIAAVLVTMRFSAARKKRKADLESGQGKALLAMFTAVKHELSNDIQVVLGNSELIQMQTKPVGNANDNRQNKTIADIQTAARLAMERIQQLEKCCSVIPAEPRKLDFNALLRETVTRLASEVSPLVNVQLELDKLSGRVVTDKQLFTLSLTHLLKQAAKSMPHGGDIVVSTQSIKAHRFDQRADCRVVLEVIVLRESLTESTGHDDERALNVNFKKLRRVASVTATLLEKCGARVMHRTDTDSGTYLSVEFAGLQEKQEATETETLGRVYG